MMRQCRLLFLVLAAFWIASTPLFAAFDASCARLLQINPNKSDTQFYPLTELKDLSKERLTTFLQASQNILRGERNRRMNNMDHLEAFYAGIKNRFPSDVYIRALDVKEITEIISDGRIQAGQYFGVKGSAHVGHNNNFLFLVCRQCADGLFREAPTGSGTVITEGLPMERFELAIPSAHPD